MPGYPRSCLYGVHEKALIRAFAERNQCARAALRGVQGVTEDDAALDGAGLRRVEPMHRMRVADPFEIAWTNATVDARAKSRVDSQASPRGRPCAIENRYAAARRRNFITQLAFGVTPFR